MSPLPLYFLFLLSPLAPGPTPAPQRADSVAEKLQGAWRWRRLDPGHILPPVARVAATPEGHLLALSADGVHRYDGYGWRQVAGVPPVPATQVLDMAAGNSGALLRTRRLLFLLDEEGGYRELVDREEDGQLAGPAPGGDGQLLVGVADEVQVLRDGSLHTLTASPDGAALRHLAAAPGGRLWCVTGTACYEVTDGNWNRLASSQPRLAPRGLGEALALDGGGALFLPWPTTLGQTVYRADGGAAKPVPISTSGVRITAAAALPGDVVLLATLHDGLILLEEDGFTPIRSLPLTEEWIAKLVRLRNRLVALTGSGELLACDLGSRRWSVYPPPTPEPGLGTVNALAMAENGALWVGTAGGLLCLPPGAARLEAVEGPELRGITALLESEGRLWVAGGAGFAGAWEFDGEHWIHHTEEEGIGRYFVHNIRKAPDGSLWFLLLDTTLQGRRGGGAAVLREGRWERHGPESAKPAPRVYDVVFPEVSREPIAATDRGVFRHTETGWQPLAAGSPGQVFRLHLHNSGEIWAGAGFRGQGLWRLREGRWDSMEVPGLRAGNAAGFAEGPSGKMWLASPYGLLLWTEGQLLQPGAEAGSPSHSFWPVLAARDGDGCWLGTLGRGLVRFRADDRHAPRVIALEAHPAESRGAIHVEWRAADWWEETDEESLLVRVRVDGGAWQAVQGATSLLLHETGAGRHEIEVRAIDALGNASPEPARAVFSVPRPFLERPEGIALILALGAAALVLGYSAWRRQRDLVRAHQQREQLLAASERHFRDLVESADLVLTHYDRHGRMVYSSPQVETLTGYRPEDFLADPGLGDRLIHPEDRASNERLREMRRAGSRESVTHQFRIRHRDGLERHVLERQSPRLDDQGRVQGYDAVAVDLTELEHLRRALARSEERFRGIVEALQEGIWILGPDGRTVYANRRMAEILGLPEPAALQDLRLEDHVGAETAAAVTEALARAQGGRPARCEATLRTAGGERGWVLLGMSPLPAEADAGTGVVVACADISEERRSREALLQTQKLESLGVLAGGIAHDFNNLLVAMLGNANLVRQDLEAGSPQEAMVADIESAANRAAELCRQMLAYAGKGSTSRSRVDLSDVVRGMVQLLEVSISKRVSLGLELARRPVLVDGDATQLRQVVMNLVVNASEAIGEAQGQVRVVTSHADLEREELDGLFGGRKLAPGNYALLVVEDDGCGMDARTLERIFDPFFSTKFPGRGLGLASVLGIVHSHGGAMGVRSTPGEGTRFSVVLPVAGAVQEQSDPAEGAVRGR